MRSKNIPQGTKTVTGMNKLKEGVMFNRFTYRFALGLVSLFFLVFAQEVMADQVILINGDSLSGTIEKSCGW